MLPDTSTTPPTEPKVEPTSTETVKTGGKTFTEAELEQIIKERLTREKAKQDKAASEAAEKAKAEEAAKNGEFKTLAEQREKELADLKAQLRSRELTDLKRQVAAKVGLPVGMESRIFGETEAELEADAKQLFDTLPKPTKPQPGVVTNPGAPQQGETYAQQRERLGF